MRRLTLTYGVLPTEQQFLEACDAALLLVEGFAFRNDARFGDDCGITPTQLWDEVRQAMREWEASDGALGVKHTDGWVSFILEVIGIEWV